MDPAGSGVECLRAAPCLLLLCGLLATGPLARAAPATPDEPCALHRELAPARAVVGQQVLQVIQIGRGPQVGSSRWLRPPAHPDFRVERLPGRPEQREPAGTRWMRAERMALFPARAGELVLPAARLRCLVGGGDGDAGLPFDVELPPRTFRVDPLPAAGRPAGFGGLVGPVSAWVSLSPARVRLGETAHVSLGLSGAANLWDAVLPEPTGEPPGFDVFARAGDLDFERGELLQARRIARFDIVPREIGRLRFAPLRIAWYDPNSGRYRLTETGLPELEVEPPGSPARQAVETAPAAPAPVPARRRPVLPVLLLGLLAAFGVAVPLLVRRRSRGAPLRIALADARRAVEAGDPRAEAAALERALRSALGERAPELAERPPTALAPRAAGDRWLLELAERLAALERARFGAPDELAAALEAARRWLAEQRRSRADRR